MWITSGLLHISTALDCGWVSTPDAGRPELWGIAVRRQSQCQEISTCPVPTEVLSAQIVEAWMMFPRGDITPAGFSVRSHHIMITPLARTHIIPIVRLLGTAHADSHTGNCYLLDVCLICSYSSWLAITGQRGRVAPEALCHC